MPILYKMYNFNKYSFIFLISFLYLNANAINANEINEANIQLSKVSPLYNWHWKYPRDVGYKQRRQLVQVNQAVPYFANEKILKTDESIKINAAKGEMVYTGILLQSDNDLSQISIEITDFSNKQYGKIDTESNIKIVTSWFQAGKATRISKRHSFLTYELLLDDDQSVKFIDKWLPAKNGSGWIYHPPAFERLSNAKTSLLKDLKKRLLILMNIPLNSKSGKYVAYLYITKNTKKKLLSTIELNIFPFVLSPVDPNKFKILTYTGISLDPMPGRNHSYLNSNRLHGNKFEKKEIFKNYVSDLVAHGFNGITIKDWRTPYLEEVLSILKKEGIKYPILHAHSPVNMAGIIDKNIEFPVINKHVIDSFRKFNYEPIFFGVDEAGGNRKLEKQLSMNRKIHKYGGKIFNALFWNDRANVLKKTADNKNNQFDMLTYSMGSHGQKKFFKSLPLNQNKDPLLPKGTEQYAYWHPNEENPLINRLFMGFWLWASGLSGIAPHGHYFPPHIEKIITLEDIKYSKSTRSSPYDDWAFWLPPGKLRHHTTVYPSQDGPVSTLQWEGIRDGITDLRYMLMLENSVLNNMLNDSKKIEASNLVEDIRGSMLKISSSHLSDKSSGLMQIKLDKWRKEIQILLMTSKYNLAH